jgi:DNA-binding Lrp family transcriptional regulator
MDDLDRQLLNILQTEFPVTRYPYRILGEQLGISEDEVLARTRNLVDSGVIRKIGASFSAGKLGYLSALVAAKVPEDRLEEVAGIVGAYPQVTHNYARDFEHNLWFTLICRDDREMEGILAGIRSSTGITDFHALPAERTFKIKVDFEF